MQRVGLYPGTFDPITLGHLDIIQRATKLVDRLTCLTTPGAAIAAVVTEAGIAIHPSRSTLATAAKRAGLPLKSLQDLRQLAGPPSQPGRGQGRIIAECEAPTGDIIDTIRTA